MTAPIGLVADIGGTNVRFALVGADGTMSAVANLRCADYPGPAEAARAYLQRAGAAMPPRAAFCVASPVNGDVVSMTNSPWCFSTSGVAETLGVVHLDVVNDFTAVALCLPHLGPEDSRPVGGGTPQPDGTIGVLGPGTGLGVAGLVPARDAWVPIPGEGGHVTMAAANDHEARVLATLRERFGHVSAERVLSGPGLVNLYTALCRLNGRDAQDLAPDQITDGALEGTCPMCRAALDLFFAMLGTVAGDLALTLGARGGIYIAGGILPDMPDAFAASDFRARFEDKGRFRGYMAGVPARLILHPYPAFLGLAGLLHEEGPRVAL